MSKLLILKGLPASGKSTFAKALVYGLITQDTEEYLKMGNWKRVNKDDLRSMIDNGKWNSINEKQIKKIETEIVIGFLHEGFNVVIDDTNFSYESFWTNLASRNQLMGVESEIKLFDVSVQECIERDSKRGDKSVGAKVIMGMYNKYLKPKLVEHNELLPNCYIFDIDGTLALMDGRSPYDYTKVSADKPNRDIVALFKNLAMLPNTSMIIVSGREESCQQATKDWLFSHDIMYKDLFMRSAGDHRDDRIVKGEIYDKYIKGKYNVLAVFDDRDRVVGFWRSVGLTCLQVYYGNF